VGDTGRADGDPEVVAVGKRVPGKALATPFDTRRQIRELEFGAKVVRNATLSS
jgi:hypothetical protein